MERLTGRNSDGGAFYKNCFREDTCAGIGCSEKCDHCKHSYNACEKLAVYEDAEEQGVLIRLPCKVGDTVYQHMIVGINELKKPIYKIYEAKVFKYVLDSNTLCFWTETKDNFKYRNEMPLSAFCKTVFLTREEAEAALAEMEK